jgi:hypothetical protein
MITGQNIKEQEQIEGLGNDEDSSLGDYPIDTLLIRTETRTIYDVLRRIEQGSYVMQPDFQRDFIWPDDKQSKLIESVLMRIPLPVFYLSEDKKGRMVVVDGLQRLSTFKRFVSKNDLSLKLPKQKELNGKKFKELSVKLQNRVEDFNLILYLIDSKVPERAKLDIFERVNSGIPLTRQQMRNCLYMGKATQFLKTEAETTLFKKVTGKSLSSSSMRDREFVNRFCAFYLLPLHEYKGDMDDFLAKALEKMNLMSDESLSNLSLSFRNGLENNWLLFEEHAFRKSFFNSGKRSVINASLWDVFSTALSKCKKEQLIENKSIIKPLIYALYLDDNFNNSITLGTNEVRRVNYRFRKINDLIEEIFDADPIEFE